MSNQHNNNRNIESNRHGCNHSNANSNRCRRNDQRRLGETVSHV